MLENNRLSQKVLAAINRIATRQLGVLDTLKEFNGFWLGHLNQTQEFQILNYLHLIDENTIQGIGQFSIKGSNDPIIFELWGRRFSDSEFQIEYECPCTQGVMKGIEILFWNKDKNTLSGSYFGSGQGEKYSGTILLSKMNDFYTHYMT